MGQHTNIFSQVKDLSSLQDSLKSMLTMEKLEGPNQYECDSCNQKADALKGIMIRKYPPILTLSLSRFDFDLEKLQRVKIDSKFTFGLELDVSTFSEKPDAYVSEDERVYELCAVIIHKGDAFGGHYKAYIRDNLKEGDWKRLMTGESQADEKERPSEEEKGNGEPDNKLSQEEQKILDDIADKDTTDDEKVNKPSKQNEQAVNHKKNKKSKKKRRRGQNSNKNPPSVQKKESVDNKKDAEKEKYDDTIFDEVPFPFEFTNQDLKVDWFEFNDSVVTSIPMNRLQYQFGGTPENAYILIYRQKVLNKKLDSLEIKIPKYMKMDIDERNSLLESERMIYDEAANNIECLMIDPNYFEVIIKPNLREFNTLFYHFL